MAKKRNYHITKRGDGDWQVKREGASRASSRHPTQAEAAERARDLAREQHVEVVIHRPDGRIRDSDSYGKDPNPPRDRKH
jgi:uncharacterized protein YdaT